VAFLSLSSHPMAQACRPQLWPWMPWGKLQAKASSGPSGNLAWLCPGPSAAGEAEGLTLLSEGQLLSSFWTLFLLK
jgi:hypothetical protein